MSGASLDAEQPNLNSTDFDGTKGQVNVNSRFGRMPKSAGYALDMNQINVSGEFGYVESEE